MVALQQRHISILPTFAESLAGASDKSGTLRTYTYDPGASALQSVLVHGLVGLGLRSGSQKKASVGFLSTRSTQDTTLL